MKLGNTMVTAAARLLSEGPNANDGDVNGLIDASRALLAKTEYPGPAARIQREILWTVGGEVPTARARLDAYRLTELNDLASFRNAELKVEGQGVPRTEAARRLRAFKAFLLNAKLNGQNTNNTVFALDHIEKTGPKTYDLTIRSKTRSGDVIRQRGTMQIHNRRWLFVPKPISEKVLTQGRAEVRRQLGNAGEATVLYALLRKETVPPALLSEGVDADDIVQFYGYRYKGWTYGRTVVPSERRYERVVVGVNPDTLETRVLRTWTDTNGADI